MTALALTSSSLPTRRTVLLPCVPRLHLSLLTTSTTSTRMICQSPLTWPYTARCFKRWYLTTTSLSSICQDHDHRLQPGIKPQVGPGDQCQLSCNLTLHYSSICWVIFSRIAQLSEQYVESTPILTSQEV